MRGRKSDQQQFPVYTPSPGEPSPWWVREEFNRLMKEELIGPKDGEDEELLTKVERLVRTRYVLGVLAPLEHQALR